MEYLVLVIYVITVSQFINSNPINKGGITVRGRNFYRMSGLTNMTTGLIGVNLVNI